MIDAASIRALKGKDGRDVVRGHAEGGLTADMVEGHYPSSQHQPDECEMCRAIHDIAKEALNAALPIREGGKGEG